MQAHLTFAGWCERQRAMPRAMYKTRKEALRLDPDLVRKIEGGYDTIVRLPVFAFVRISNRRKAPIAMFDLQRTCPSGRSCRTLNLLAPRRRRVIVQLDV
jgi:hypothetical protein